MDFQGKCADLPKPRSKLVWLGTMTKSLGFDISVVAETAFLTGMSRHERLFLLLSENMENLVL